MTWGLPTDIPPQDEPAGGSLVENTSEIDLKTDGDWRCHHGVRGLSCDELTCRYRARILEALNRHQRLATERRRQKGEVFPKGCYLDPRRFTDEEKVNLAREWESIKAAFRAAGLEIPEVPE